MAMLAAVQPIGLVATHCVTYQIAITYPVSQTVLLFSRLTVYLKRVFTLLPALLTCCCVTNTGSGFVIRSALVVLACSTHCYRISAHVYEV
jgi:hypothetical protein